MQMTYAPRWEHGGIIIWRLNFSRNLKVNMAGQNQHKGIWFIFIELKGYKKIILQVMDKTA